jgi:hypothetical protein
MKNSHPLLANMILYEAPGRPEFTSYKLSGIYPR